MIANALPAMLLLILIGVLCFVFWLIMLIDSITRKFKDGTEKIIWVLVNILLGLLGSLIYYFVVFKNDGKKSIKWFWWILLILVSLMIVAVAVLLSTPAGYGN
ncbi:MAG: PLDc N-terminal domain-containing protein [Nanoarchaeota archaeon]